MVHRLFTGIVFLRETISQSKIDTPCNVYYSQLHYSLAHSSPHPSKTPGFQKPVYRRQSETTGSTLSRQSSVPRSVMAKRGNCAEVCKRDDSVDPGMGRVLQGKRKWASKIHGLFCALCCLWIWEGVLIGLGGREGRWDACAGVY